MSAQVIIKLQALENHLREISTALDHGEAPEAPQITQTLQAILEEMLVLPFEQRLPLDERLRRLQSEVARLTEVLHEQCEITKTQLEQQGKQTQAVHAYSSIQSLKR